jgi:hypothetical protein
MPSTQIQQIQDAELRALMQQADARLDEGDNTGCVHRCADAYLMILEKYPAVLNGLRKVMETPRVKAGLENGTLRFAPLMFPRLAAKLRIPPDRDGAPTITFDREQLGFGEAIQYYEFTLNLITDAEKGTLQMGEGGGGLG